jgi:hypothetical protein
MGKRAALFCLGLVLSVNLFPAIAGTHTTVAPSRNLSSSNKLQGRVEALRKIRAFSYTNTDILHWNFKLAYDNTFVFIATPDGLFRVPKTQIANGPLELIGFADKPINNIYVHNNMLYVLLAAGTSPGTVPVNHSLFKSVDHGGTFVPIDKGLESCFQGYCEYLSASQAVFQDDLIFLNAGGNLLVSKEGTGIWTALVGDHATQACYYPSFELVGNRVLIGGECPLDFAYLRAGTLRSDFFKWNEAGPPKAVITPPLENRNLQFIKQEWNSPIVFASVEGGLLKSADFGQSFKFVIDGATDRSGEYPYARDILFPSTYQDLVVVGGYNKGTSYLAYSSDNGESWIDISSLVQTPQLTGNRIFFLSEDAQQRVIVGLADTQTQLLTIAEVLMEPSSSNPIILTEEGTERAVALDSVTLVRAPFTLLNTHNFSSDQRTRIALFMRNVPLPAGEDFSIVTAQAEDLQHKIYPLKVEFVGKVPDHDWLTQVNVKLPDEINTGDIWISISVRGVESNKALVSIKPASCSNPP